MFDVANSTKCQFEFDEKTGVCYRTLDFLGFPGYRVGDDGSVWRLGSLGNWYKTEAQLREGRNHPTVRITRITRREIRVFELVLNAFIGKCPPGATHTHDDGNPHNNSLRNLSWVLPAKTPTFEFDPAANVCYRLLDFMGFPGWRVGDDGSMQSCWSSPIGHGDKGGFHCVLTNVWKNVKPVRHSSIGHLGINIKKRNRAIHVFVLSAFVGPCPEEMECCHNNGNPTDNHITNLRWDTHRANAKDRDKHGRLARGEKCNLSKLTESVVRQIRADGHADQARGRFSRLAAKYGVSRNAIVKIITRKTWTHI